MFHVDKTFFVTTSKPNNVTQLSFTAFARVMSPMYDPQQFGIKKIVISGMNFKLLKCIGLFNTKIGCKILERFLVKTKKNCETFFNWCNQVLFWCEFTI